MDYKHVVSRGIPLHVDLVAKAWRLNLHIHCAMSAAGQMLTWRAP